MAVSLFACKSKQPHRFTLNLDGKWQIAQTTDTLPPDEYKQTIPVPGLMDLAEPAFDSAGYKCGGRNYYWYRKIVRLEGERTDFAYLKTHKAKFGHAVYVNGTFAGKSNFCFTPSCFEISRLLKWNDDNEILIRVGADPSALPDTIPYGHDIEKSMYYPGIYDHVELFTANYPYIENVQIVPDIDERKIKVAVWLKNGSNNMNFVLDYAVNEYKSKTVVTTGSTSSLTVAANETMTFDFEIDIPDCKLWSPESPFLYELILKTPGDSRKVKFGMREFYFDTKSKLAILNGKPYYLRGTNIAIHRFFEDPARKRLPWNRQWIEKMHDEFRDMHWNSYRFHVGFAPEIWYEIADEMGFLVQDEYAIWGLFMKDTALYSPKEYDKLSANALVAEYELWMKERWNHPSVVIWDAQNETWCDQTGQALKKVRHLDLSNRPWDNGFSPPQAETDMLESHPYLFAHDQALTFNVNRSYPSEGLLAHDLGKHPEPFNDPNMYEPPSDGGKYQNPVIVNEYGWIWLYRDGSPASVAETIWSFYPQFDTPEKRWEWRGRVVAIKTEYWRSKRNIAGVQHFCALTCNRPWRPRSQVSDEWLDVENLVMQPLFKKYVKPAFSPVGIMINRFDEFYKASQKLRVPLILYNDLYQDWIGEVRFTVLKNNVPLINLTRMLKVEKLGKTNTEFEIELPSHPGKYEMTAQIMVNGENVFSSRLFEITE